MKRLVPLLSVLLLTIAFASEAALRARYCCPYANHRDTWWDELGVEKSKDIGSAGTPHAYRIQALQGVEPGMWEGYDVDAGFDHVSDLKGDLSAAPLVDAVFWVDSVFEPLSTDNANRKTRPFFDHWGSDASAIEGRVVGGGEGYFIVAAGGLQIDETGEYSFLMRVSNRGNMWLDLNRDGEIDLSGERDDAELECIFGNLRSEVEHAAWEMVGNESTVTVNIPQTGLHKVVVYYYFHSQQGHIQIEWKKPGDTEFAPITAEDFGKPRDPLPKVNITSLQINCIEQANFLVFGANECDLITITAAAENVDPEGDLEYIWNLGFGEPVTTQTNTISYRLPFDPEATSYSVSVNVNDGSRLSTKSEPPVLFFPPVDDPEIDGCDGMPVDPCVSVNQKDHASRKGINSQRLLRSAGANSTVVVTDISGRKVFSERALNFSMSVLKQSISSGYYTLTVFENGRVVNSMPLVVGVR